MGHQALQCTRTLLSCNDERKGSIAQAVTRQTTVPLDWIVEKRHMGTLSRVAGTLSNRLATAKKPNKRRCDIIERVAE